MAVTVPEIKEMKEYYQNELYGDVRTEQTEDESYYTDTFKVEGINTPHKPLRSGLARKIIDNPSEQMITRNPKVYIETKNDDATERLSKLTNRWAELLRRQNPNPFKESVKNPLLRGETYLYLQHNEALVTGEETLNKLPVFFIIPDPVTVYASVEEDENGIPDRVFIICERNQSDIKFLYPDWKSKDEKKRKVAWVAYFDKDVKYFEADGVPVFEDELQPNVYGFTPFIRRYSGFGRRDSANSLVNMIVGELRGSRGLLKEECLVRSDIASALHLYAHPRELWQIPQDAEIDNAKIQKAYDFSAGTFTILPMPEGSKRIENAQLTPVPEVFSHLSKIQADIISRHPMIMAGTTVSNSGRQDDIMGKTMMHRYDTILENTETMFATGIEQAFEICKKVGYTPDGLKSEDLDRDFTVSVTLQAEDPLDRDRLITLGDRMFSSGTIDLGTLHTQYYGYTQEKSNQIIADMLVDKLTLENPDVQQVMGMVFAQESGQDRWIQEAKGAKMAEAEQAKALSKATPPSQQQRTMGEANPMSETSFAMIDESLKNKGSRKPPINYQRNSNG